MLKVDIFDPAKDFIKSQTLDRQKQIAKKINMLRESPTSGETKPLVGYDFLRTRCGDYRIIHDNDGETLNVLLVGLRDDDAVYKELKRLYG